ncbi:hypothetical protein [Rubellicoccus peritrichatus]|uniref:Uncharacterized protein n=1 Tax=Rubellicoccus peritrichatus TaxID=3080537 RepID=A0AAQ3LEY4_9BACT|nr:hypothetical protein [Puniceicoccus sp. CR14]WOO43492.1 hypothetical protein RZN69_10360 [Puniceicoccus sp. CR14]
MQIDITRATTFFAGIILGAAVACAEPIVDARFDQSFLTADFEGEWAGLPVESEEDSPVQVNAESETVVFSNTDEVSAAVTQSLTESSLPNPLFVSYSLFPTGRSVVFGVAESETADVVLIENGQDQGYRTGMICEVLNADGKVGEIILVEVRSDRAAGLITQLEDNRVIRFGDDVRIKPVQYL